jgi:hypothetical protein
MNQENTDRPDSVCAKKILGFTSLTPPENGAGEFSGRKTRQHFPRKMGSRLERIFILLFNSGHLQGGSRVCTLLVYLSGGGAVQTCLHSLGCLHLVRRPLQLRLLLILTTTFLTRALRRSYMCRGVYRGTSPTRKRNPLGPYRRPMPRVLGGSQEGGRFLMGEVPL